MLCIPYCALIHLVKTILALQQKLNVYILPYFRSLEYTPCALGLAALKTPVNRVPSSVASIYSSFPRCIFYHYFTLGIMFQRKIHDSVNPQMLKTQVFTIRWHFLNQNFCRCQYLWHLRFNSISLFWDVYAHWLNLPKFKVVFLSYF